MGKIRYLFKKIRDIKGTFHANMGSIKDRHGMALIPGTGEPGGLPSMGSHRVGQD